MLQKPSNAFIAASWIAVGTGITGFISGLWRADMALNEKGYYFTVLMFGLFAVISVQKSVRDRLENIPVTDMYYGICWFATILSLLLLTIGLWNADLQPSEKGFYAFAFLLSLFGAITVQKNIRDKAEGPLAQIVSATPKNIHE
ncbi:MAG: inner membrane protein YiaA [Ferruginibacter sp.]